MQDTDARNVVKKVDELANEREAEREAKVVIGPEAFFSAKRTFCSQPAPKFVDGFCKVQKIMVLMRLRPT